MRIVPTLQVIRNDLVIFPMQEFFYGKISRLHKFVSLGFKRFVCPVMQEMFSGLLAVRDF